MALIILVGAWVIHLRRSYWLMVYPLLLVGCAVTEVRDAGIRTVVIRPEPGAVTDNDNRYVLSGRLSVHNLQQKFSATINWRHYKNEDQIHLYAPLGQTIARIEQDMTGVYLITAESTRYRAENVEQLTQQILGWELPLSGLHFWIRGMYFPLTIAELDLDRSGRVVAIRQDGWEIRYSKFFPPKPGMQELPKLLELNRHNLKIKLIIDRWLYE